VLSATALTASWIVAVWTIGGVTRELDTSGWSDSPKKLFSQAARRWQDLATVPSAYWTQPPESGSIRAAQYLHRCTRPTDRVLVMPYAPEILGLSGRLFAAGRSRIASGEYTSESNQRSAVARWSAEHVPIVLADDTEEYDSTYPSEFPLIHAYLSANYDEAGRIEIDGGRVLRVMTRRGETPAGTYDGGLPCFR
jgi:hypothetical protein